MKLRELVDQLQEILKSNPELDVRFELADVHAGGITTRAAYLLDVRANGPNSTSCLITLGNYEGDAALYKEHMEMLKGQTRTRRSPGV